MEVRASTCRWCGRRFAPDRSWYYACPECWAAQSTPSPRARLQQRPGQLSMFDADPEPPAEDEVEEEPSAFIAWLDAEDDAA